LKKYCSHLERGFLGVGEALAKESRHGGMTERNEAKTPKDRSLFRPFQMAATFLKML
jgi:hypothetical protein